MTTETHWSCGRRTTMSEMDLRLNCTRCGSFEEYENGDSSNVVYCDECGKKHSTNSVHFVGVDKQYERDEAGNLLEDVL
jgi:uncharacterized Zn ribbon protein